MVSPKMLHRLATNPHDHMRFLTTGRLPRGVRPTSPLITLLKAINPHDRARLVGVQVDSRLGYTGSRQFHYGGQVLTWICPSDEVFGAFPADSWRDKRFTGPLYLETLAECCASFPPEFFQRYRQLCKPQPRRAVTLGATEVPPAVSGEPTDLAPSND
jgi:hypothetical protein